ncbi:AtpZ/AtpI family protein [Halomonas sp. CS7]|uniref:AtpZ/AtpI family protein n=1 Tax=Halomonas pelophila TaxID=3151122 RepID=A0ABV1N5K8_9GAMM
MTRKRKSPVEDIGRRARRREKARDDPGSSPLRGLGVFGMIGWSIAVPTVGGAFLGLWLDRHLPQAFNWTLALILGGVALGSFIAWAWASKEANDNGSEHDDD